jgi:NAD(P)-dependent dehydrogenase (short-subunit alcohol dehydrogenase family)
LIVASRDGKRMAEQLKPLRDAGRNVHAEEVNLGDETSIHAMRDRVLAAHGRIDGVVYNAVSRPMRTMGDSLAIWRESMETNATGFFAIVRALGDAMAKQGSGSVVNIASMQGMIGMNPWLYEGTSMTAPPDYFFHKGGMINLTRYLASHYGPSSVRVNAVSPGGIYNTEKPQAGPFLERYAKVTMLGRMAAPEEVVGAVVFLLSDASTYITGTNLPVDGGYTAK